MNPSLWGPKAKLCSVPYVGSMYALHRDLVSENDLFLASNPIIFIILVTLQLFFFVAQLKIQWENNSNVLNKLISIIYLDTVINNDKTMFLVPALKNEVKRSPFTNQEVKDKLFPINPGIQIRIKKWGPIISNLLDNANSFRTWICTVVCKC